MNPYVEAFRFISTQRMVSVSIIDTRNLTVLGGTSRKNWETESKVVTALLFCIYDNEHDSSLTFCLHNLFTRGRSGILYDLRLSPRGFGSVMF